MKSLGDSLQRVLVSRLAGELENSMSLEDFTHTLMYLDRYNSVFKTLPYDVWDTDDKLNILSSSEAGMIMHYWLKNKTTNIKTGQNKGRKVVRCLKAMVHNLEPVLPYNTSVYRIFVVSLAAFFIDTSKELPFPVPESLDESTISGGIENLQIFLASLFFLETVSTEEKVLNVLSLFICPNKGEFLFAHIISEALDYVQTSYAYSYE